MENLRRLTLAALFPGDSSWKAPHAPRQKPNVNTDDRISLLFIDMMYLLEKPGRLSGYN